jgi:hypothetical protein
MAEIIRDTAQNPVPQYLSRDGSAFENVKGDNGASDVNLISSDGNPISSTNPLPTSLTGIYTKDYFSGSTTTTKDYSSTPMTGFDISNDGATSLTVTVNGMTFTYKSGETDSRNLLPFTSLAITTTSAFRCWVRG